MGNLSFLIALGKETAEGDLVEVGGFEGAGNFDIGDGAQLGSAFLSEVACDVLVGVGQCEVGARTDVGDGTTKERESCRGVK